MMGKTHVRLGVASALALAQPATIPSVIAAIIGGAVGGWIVDIDCRKGNHRRYRVDGEDIKDAVKNAVFIGIFILVDFILGDGICQYISENREGKVWAGCIGLLVLLLLGYLSAHRTFTHSLLGMALFSGAVYYFCAPVVIPFAAGYASHLAADFLNKVGIQLCYPFPWRVCLKLCSADGTVNDMLGWGALAADVLLGACFFLSAMR